MRNFRRPDPTFSLCGLNCGLCVMYVGGYCPGCGGGEGNQPCAVARCSQNHEGVLYCIHCQEYPCAKFQGLEVMDSFIVHRNRKKDLEKMKSLGLEHYQKELQEKMSILGRLLSEYNDGRRKSFFALSVNLLELSDLQEVMKEMEERAEAQELTLKEKAKTVAELLKGRAQARDVSLILHRKKKS